MIELDGSHGEGGGQILRTAVGLAAVTGKAVKITKIRENRPEKGMKAQHLAGIEACAKICSAKVRGAKEGSTVLEFTPGEIIGGNHEIKVGTAGSVTLVLQTILLPLAHAEKAEIRIEGGTHVKWSPTTDYFQSVFAGILTKRGFTIKSSTERIGFYPKGGGLVAVTTFPHRLEKIEMTQRGKRLRTNINSTASEELRADRVAERQTEGASAGGPIDGYKRNEYVQTASAGSAVHMHTHYENTVIGADALGESRQFPKGNKSSKRVEDVGKECALALKKEEEAGGCLDRWMTDQILPYMALAGGGRVAAGEITEHARTNMKIIEKFLPVKFTTEGRIIKCREK